MSRQRAIYEYGGGRRRARTVREEGTTQVPAVVPEIAPETVPITPLEATSECVPWVHLERDPPEYAACLDAFGQLGQITTSKDVWNILHDRLDKEDQEVGIVLLLDVGLKVRGAAEVSRGDRSGTIVPIPDILRLALIDGSDAIVFVHNHPTGLSAPSDDDKTSTLALAAACEAVGLVLMDHVICGRGEYYSFADSGILKSEPVMPEEPGTPVVADSGARRPLASDRHRWDALHAAYVPAIEAARAMQRALEQKYQDTRWAGRGEQSKLETLRARADKIGDKIVDLIVKVSPRGEAWLTGAPAWWLREKLTWEDAIRPANEPLSVQVPAPWGATHGLQENPIVEDRASGARRGWEHRRERDEFVIQNLDPSLVPLWERLKGQFRGTPEQRYEQFTQYVHDHPDEQMGALQQDADAWLETELRRRGYAAEMVAENPVPPGVIHPQMKPVEQGLRDMARRMDQAEADFLEILMTAGGISKADAEKVFQTYKKLKVVKMDAVNGTVRVTHGGFLDRDVILRALNQPEAEPRRRAKR
jgi:DNA repair protein RadC